MSELLKGAPVAAAIREAAKDRVEVLKEQGVTPTLAIIRVGERPDDLSYETGAKKRAENFGIAIQSFVLPENVEQKALEEVIHRVNEEETIHGVLLLRPLPKHLDEKSIVAMLAPKKDVDGITDGSLAGVFTGKKLGFPPCTAEACMKILEHYQIDCTGKKAVVAGRSLVVGKPLSMMLLAQNATVTICHTRTKNLEEEMRAADIVVAAAGQKGAFGPDCFREGQIVLDVGIHFGEDGKMCGDVLTGQVQDTVAAITPVPGGVGAVTTAVLMSHVVEAAERSLL
jgi:methylenetetrahydrofolate dehydrogenase (NADP+)/methenyltetrahydrofolate cyclohydrolase